MKNTFYKKACVCLALLSFCLAGTSVLAAGTAGDAKELFYKANTAYGSGDYASAIAEYEKALDSGYESSNLYYNLANSYFRKGELGRAILNYERAKRLIPRGSDLKSSSDYALGFVKRTARNVTKIMPLRVMHTLAGSFTVNEVTIFLSVLFCLLMAMVLAHLYFNWARHYLALLIIAAAFFAGGAFILAVDIKAIGRVAVIVVEKTGSKFEPFERATTHFTLYEGTKVTVLATRGDWYKVRRSDGRIGWVEKRALEII